MVLEALTSWRPWADHTVPTGSLAELGHLSHPNIGTHFVTAGTNLLSFSVNDGTDGALNQPHRTAIDQLIATQILPEERAVLSGRRKILLTGLTNPDTSASYGYAHAAAYGETEKPNSAAESLLTVIGVAHTPEQYKDRGYYFSSGLGRSVWNDDWRLELPFIVHRTLMTMKLSESPVDIDGYSKGGLFVYALGLFRAIYKDKGKITAENLRHFPGLETPLMLRQVNELAARMIKDKTVLTATGAPAYGADDHVLEHVVARIAGHVTGQATQSFSREAIGKLYAETGYRFEDVIDRALYGQLSRQDGHTVFHNPGTEYLTPSGRALLVPLRAQLLTYASDSPGPSDGLSRFDHIDPKFLATRTTILPGYDHISMLYTPQTAISAARLTARHLLDLRNVSGPETFSPHQARIRAPRTQRTVASRAAARTAGPFAGVTSRLSRIISLKK